MATITVLFVDQVDSTLRLSQLGERGVATDRDALFRILRSAVADHDGEVVDHTGDGVMAVFTGAREALDAAAAMQLGASTLDGVRLRIGLNTGEPSIDGDGRWFGLPLVVSARLCAKAPAGEILAATIIELLTRDDHLVDPQRYELKGIGEPVEAYRYDWRAATAGASTLALPVTADLRLVGRGAELDAMQARWREVSEGASALVLLAGEPGAGKSRLAAEFLRTRPDAVALVGRCDEGIGAPFQPFVDALRAHIDTFGRADLGSAPHELARLLPELADPDRPPLSSDPGTERQALFDAVVSWLSASASARPLVLVIDDLHWAAEPCLLLLVHLLRSRPPRLLVVTTHRDTDVDPESPLGRAMADLLRLPGATTIPLRGLTPDDVRELASHAGVGADTAEVAARTAGNPLFVTELLLHPSESGGVPTSVTSLLSQRMARLPQGTTSVLECAALSGQEFSVELLEEALARAADGVDRVVLDAVEAAERAGLVQESEDGHRFTHALIRDALVAGLGRTRAGRLHVALAEAAAALGMPKTEVARHLLACGERRRLDEAVDAALAAARELFAALSFEDAVQILREAMDVLPEDHPRRARLVLEIGEVMRRRRQAAAALPYMREAVELARRHGDAEVLARATLALTGAYIGGGLDPDVGFPLAAEALALLPPDDSVLRARLLAASAFLEPDDDRSARFGDDATAMAARLGGHVLEGYVAEGVTMATMRRLPGAWPEFVEATNRMRERCATSGDPELIVTAPLLGVHALGPVADFAGLERVAEEMTAAGTRHRYESALAHGELLRAMFALRDGRPDDAEALWSGAMARGVADAFAQSTGLSQLFWIRRHQGRLRELLPLLDSLPTIRSDRSRGNVIVEAHAALGLAEEGHELAPERLLDVARSLSTSGEAFQGNVVAALAASAARLPEAAERILPFLEPWSGFFAYVVHVMWIGPVDGLIGDLLEVLGDPAGALERYDRAFAQLGSLGVPVCRAALHLGVARARRGVGDEAAAVESATAAAHLAEAAHLPKVLEAARGWVA